MIKTTALNQLIKSSAVLALSLALGLAAKANTADNVNNGSSDLTAAATYSGGLPTTGNDVVFTAGAYSPSAFTLNTPGYNLSVGTLNDLSSTALTIQNTTAGSYSTITLNGGTNNTSPNTSDLLYVGSSSSLTIGGGSGGTLFLNATGSNSLDIAGSATIAGPLAGTGTLSKTGTGTLDLAGGSLVPLISTTTTASIFTGGLTISAGAVELSNTNALEGANVTNSVTNGLTFDSAVTSHTFNVGLLGGASNLALTDTGSNAVALVLTANSFGLGTTAANTTYSGVLSGAGSLTKEGSATETLSGANTYTGATTVNGGTLTVSGSLTSTSLALGGGTFTYSKTGGTQAFTTTTVNQGASAVTVGASGETVNLGTVTRNADSALDFGSTGTIDATGLSNTNGIIGGWATYGGQTTFAVAPASPGGAVTGLATYTSSATAGTTASNYSNANIDMLSNASPSAAITPNAIRFASSSAFTLTLTGTNTIGSGGILITPAASSSDIITGGTITSGTQELDITAAKNLRISSIIADNGGAVAVVINGGAGANINLNVANTYSGGTFVNSGNFLLTPGDAGSGTITLGANGSNASANLVANGSGNVANAITVNPGGNRQFYTASGSAPTYNGLITLVGGADLAVGSEGTGVITIKGGVTGTGNLQIGSPTGTNLKVNTTISTGAVNINGTLSDFSGVDTTAAVNVSAAVTGNTAILQDGTNQLFVFTGTNTNTGATTISSGDLQLGGTASSTTANGITIGAAGAVGSLSANSVIVDNGTLVIDRTGTVTQGTDLSTAGITGTGALTLYGTGTTILTAANAYTGGTSILTNTANLTAGTLQLGNGGTTGSLSTSSVIVDNGTLAIDRSNTVTEGTDFTTAANFTGTGGLSQIGTGTTILLGANAYSGGTTISAGTLQLGNGTTNGTLSTSSAITDNGTLIFDENTAVLQGTDFSGAAITGTGNVTVEGAAVTLNAANAFGSLTDLGVVNVATVAASGTAQPLGEGLVTLAGVSSTTGVINYTGGASTLGNNITVTTGDQGTIVNNGGGLLTLGGTITKNGSVLNLEGGSTSPGGFNVTGVIGGTSAGSDLNVINTSVTLSNANTYNGPTTIAGTSANAGTYDVLRAAIASAVPTASVVNLGSSTLEPSGGGDGINIFDLGGYAQSIAGLASVNDSGDKNYVVNSNGTGSYETGGSTPATTLTISPASGTSYTYGGVLGGTSSGTANNFGVTISGTGSGTETFTGNNRYSGGTTITGGTLYANNSSSTGSATGSGAVAVNGGVLAGSGYISGAVTVGTGGTLYSGALQGSGYAGTTNNNGYINQSPVGSGGGTGGGLHLSSSSALQVNGTLTFAMGNGGSSGSTFAAPNTNTSYITTSSTVTFATTGTLTINLVDLAATSTTMDSLALRYQSPYLLIDATGGDSAFTNLVTSGDIANNGTGEDGYVLGVGTDSSYSNNFSINVLSPVDGSNITSSQNYTNLQLYLDNGQLEVVPEPGTWALMLGGLGVLLVIQRRRKNARL